MTRIWIFALVISFTVSVSAVTDDSSFSEYFDDNPQSEDTNNDQSHHHTKISKLDAKCSKSGLTVTVDFDGPFNGIIYSKGHFTNPNCRFVEPNSGLNKFTFQVPVGDCGTDHNEKSRIVNNILIFQMDESVQEIWDSAKGISCEYGDGQEMSKRHNKMVIFKPLTVGMLDVMHHPFKDIEIDCWMDIRRGTYPNTEAISGQIEIGEELAMIIYLKDDHMKYDVSVKDCWAFNMENFEDSKASKVQLTGFDGCPRKTKLIGQWEKTYDTGDSGATTIAYNNITAFKFPDSDQVHLTCNIELCLGECEETCKKTTTTTDTDNSKNEIQRPGQTTSRPKFDQKISSTRGTDRPRKIDRDQRPKPLCYPGQRDPRCPESQTETIQDYPTTSRYPQEPVTQNPYDIFTTRRVDRPCYPGEISPRCKSTTISQTIETTYRPQTQTTQVQDYETRIPNRESTNPQRTQTTQRQFYEESTTSRYQDKQNTQKPYESTTRRNGCYPGEISPRCNRPSTNRQIETTTRYDEEFTTRPTTPSRTQRPEACFPGSNDYRCYSTNTPNLEKQTERPSYETTTRRNDCYPGEISPRCRQPNTQQTSNTPTPRYRDQFTTFRPLKCLPGSKDARCQMRELETTIGQVPTTQRPFSGETTTRRKTCYPGEVSPRCRPSTNQPTVTTSRYEEDVTTTRRPETFSTSEPIITEKPYETSSSRKPLCYPGQIDPRCPPVCTEGSTDFRCRSTTQQQQYQTETTTRPPICYRGSTDPRCPQQQTSQQQEFSTTPRPICYRGSTDPRCPQTKTTTKLDQRPSTTPRAPLCYPGAVDPRCPPVCTEGSTDYRCRPSNEPDQPSYTTPAYEITTRVICYRGSTDPRCPQQSSQQQQFSTTTTQRPICYKGSTDPRCPQTTSTARLDQKSSTTRRPLCYPGAVDPRCPPVCTEGSTDYRCRPSNEPEQPKYTTQVYETTTRVICYRGSTDPRCPQQSTQQQEFSSTTTPRPVCYRGSTDLRCPQTTQTQEFSTTTTRKPICYPGSVDPRCSPDCTQGSTDFRCRSTTQQEYQTQSTSKAPNCYRGSSDPRCPQSQTTQTLDYVSTTTRKPVCYPGSVDPRCQPDCTEGSTDFRCRPTTTQQEQYQTQSTTKAPNCYRGSTDPRCSQTQTTATQDYGSTTKKPFQCYPGAIDPRCPPDCTEGSTDFRCRPTTQQQQYQTQATTRPSICYRGSTDPRCPLSQTQTTGNFEPNGCNPGDVRCSTNQQIQTTPRYQQTNQNQNQNQQFTTKPPVPSRPYQDFQTEKVTQRPSLPSFESTTRRTECYPGEISPRCRQNTEQLIPIRDQEYPITNPNQPTQGVQTQYTYRPQQTSTQRPFFIESTTTTKALRNCAPGEVSPNCRQNNETPNIPFQNYITPSRSPVCSPGSNDPKCFNQNQTQPPSPPSSTRKVLCYPGAIDPRCPPVCPSTDFRCPENQRLKYNFDTRSARDSDSGFEQIHALSSELIFKEFRHQSQPVHFESLRNGRR